MPRVNSETLGTHEERGGGGHKLRVIYWGSWWGWNKKEETHMASYLYRKASNHPHRLKVLGVRLLRISWHERWWLMAHARPALPPVLIVCCESMHDTHKLIETRKGPRSITTANKWTTIIGLTSEVHVCTTNHRDSCFPLLLYLSRLSSGREWVWYKQRMGN